MMRQVNGTSFAWRAASTVRLDSRTLLERKVKPFDINGSRQFILVPLEELKKFCQIAIFALFVSLGTRSLTPQNDFRIIPDWRWVVYQVRDRYGRKGGCALVQARQPTLSPWRR